MQMHAQTCSGEQKKMKLHSNRRASADHKIDNGLYDLQLTCEVRILCHLSPPCQGEADIRAIRSERVHTTSPR